MSTTKIMFEGITIDDFFKRLEAARAQPSARTAEDENLTVAEAAKFLRVSVPTLHRLKAANKIPFIKIGSRIIYSKSKLIQWLNKK